MDSSANLGLRSVPSVTHADISEWLTLVTDSDIMNDLRSPAAEAVRNTRVRKVYELWQWLYMKTSLIFKLYAGDRHKFNFKNFSLIL